MNAIEFIKCLQDNINKNNENDLANMPASKYFSTPAGKDMIRYLSPKVTIISENEFELFDYNLTYELKTNPLYYGRNLFNDLEELGFTNECRTDYEKGWRTYIFKAK